MFQIENKLIIYRICAYYYVNENDQYNKISGMPRIFDGK